MSKERIVKALKVLGLSNIDAQVYIFLAKQGPHKAGETAAELESHEQKVRKSFRDLESTGIVKASIEHPLEFEAMPFEEVLNLLIEVKREQAKTLQTSKDEFLSTWRSVTEEDDEEAS